MSEFDKSSSDNKAIHAKAHVGEPMFVMIGRDPVMTGIISAWIEARTQLIRDGALPDTDEEWAHVQRAERLLAATVNWQAEHHAQSKQAQYEAARARHRALYWRRAVEDSAKC